MRDKRTENRHIWYEIFKNRTINFMYFINCYNTTCITCRSRLRIGSLGAMAVWAATDSFAILRAVKNRTLWRTMIAKVLRQGTNIDEDIRDTLNGILHVANLVCPCVCVHSSSGVRSIIYIRTHRTLDGRRW